MTIRVVWSETHWIETQQLMEWGHLLLVKPIDTPKVVQVYINWFWSANQKLLDTSLP